MASTSDAAQKPADGPERAPRHDAIERGIRNYAQCVATELGLDPSICLWECAETVEAYIPLPARLPGHPDHDVALSWTLERGWALAVENGGPTGEVIDRYGGAVLPAAASVVAFVHRVWSGRTASAEHIPHRTRAQLLVELSRSWNVAR